MAIRCSLSVFTCYTLASKNAHENTVIKINQSECWPLLSHKRDQPISVRHSRVTIPICDLIITYVWHTCDVLVTNLWCIYDQLMIHLVNFLGRSLSHFTGTPTLGLKTCLRYCNVHSHSSSAIQALALSTSFLSMKYAQFKKIFNNFLEIPLSKWYSGSTLPPPPAGKTVDFGINIESNLELIKTLHQMRLMWPQRWSLVTGQSSLNSGNRETSRTGKYTHNSQNSSFPFWNYWAVVNEYGKTKQKQKTGLRTELFCENRKCWKMRAWQQQRHVIVHCT